MCLIANIVRDTKKHPGEYRPLDFLPESMRPEEKPASPEAIFAMLQAAFGGKKNN